MIDRRYQGKGYGQQALGIIVHEMQKQFACDKIYLSMEPHNAKGRYIYEKAGFVRTGDMWDDEEVYCLTL